MSDKSDKTVPFDINAVPPPGKRVLLPTMGIRDVLGNLPDSPFMSRPDAYVQAISASIGSNNGNQLSGFQEAVKALSGDTPPQAFSFSTLSFMPDSANWGLVQWPGIAPESLRKISRENLIPQLVTRSRVADIARYANLSSQPWEPGWEIVMREPTESPNTQEKKEIREAESYIANCSLDSRFKDARERDQGMITSFEMFLRASVEDMMTFDGWSTWTDMDNAGRIKAFSALPAGMIRLTLPGRGYNNDPSLFAALVDETNTPVKAFNRDQMVWRIRNKRTDPAAAGYGWPEIEICVRVIQAFQSAVDLNADTFTKNSIPNGMLVLKGDYWNQDQIDALMREWTNMKRGVSKMWGMPVIAVPEEGDISVVPFMDLKGTDVRYKDHMNMMTGLACAIWQFPVRRLGLFASGHGRDNQPVPDGSVELQGVDDPGLPPLLGHIENTINPYLLWPNWPHLRFRFLNKDPKSDARGYEAKKLARTWRESRAEADLPALSKGAPAEYKPMLDIMEWCPEDPAKIPAFQTLAVTMLQAAMGTGNAKDIESPESTMDSKTDPAKSQAHGHRAGVRRDSAAEQKTTEPSVS